VQKKILQNIGLPFLAVVIAIVISFLLFGDIEVYFIDLLETTRSNPDIFALISFFILSSDILLPVPSSIIMYINGYVLGWIGGSVLSLLALMLGATIGYYLGRFTSVGLKVKTDSNSDRLLKKYGPVAILVSRGIPVISETLCIVCGYNKMNFGRYSAFNFIGYLPLCILYAAFGQIGYDKNTFLFTFGCSLVIAAGFWFIGKPYFTKAVE
jgi:uncharacterized membrane protein YdjX (TVP38/TMEM64 family)